MATVRVASVVVIAAVLAIGCGGSDERASTAVTSSAVPGSPTKAPDVAATPTPPAGPAFRDVSTVRGIDARHHNGGTGRRYLPEIVGAGVGVLDYDGDGDLDLYLVDGNVLDPSSPATHGNELYRNDDGMFTRVTDAAGVGDRGYGMGLAVGDVDNDGDTDLYVTNLGPDVLYRNRGDGTFEDVTTSSGIDAADWSTAAVWLDYDGDGDLDLFVGTYVDFTTAKHQPCIVRGIEAYCPPTAYAAMPDRMYRNEWVETGALHFTDVSEAVGIAGRRGNALGAIAGDIDGDGDDDLYVANDRTPNFLYVSQLAQGSATFVEDAELRGCAFGEEALAEAGMGVDFGDDDGDGDLDIVVTNMEVETNSLYRNEGALGFVESSYAVGLGRATLAFVGFGVRMFDFDLDGDLDLMFANGHIMDNVAEIRQGVAFEQDAQLFVNEGGRYDEQLGRRVATPLPPRVGRGLATADFDDDGDLDVVIANNDAAPTLLENLASSASTIGLRLEGAAPGSNRDAYGARVTVRAGDRVILRQVTTAGSYLASHDPRILIALASGTTRSDVEIRWPSGVVEKLEATAGAYHHIIEGRGIVASEPFVTTE